MPSHRNEHLDFGVERSGSVNLERGGRVFSEQRTDTWIDKQPEIYNINIAENFSKPSNFHYITILLFGILVLRSVRHFESRSIASPPANERRTFRARFATGINNNRKVRRTPLPPERPS